MASWADDKKGYKPELVANQMEKVKSVSGKGEVSFRAFEHSEYAVLLNDMIVLNEGVPEPEKRRIIHKATFEVGAKGPITKQSILAEIGKLERAYLSKREQKFRLITDISISRSSQLKTVLFDGSRIAVQPFLNKALTNSRNKLLDDAKDWLTNDLPKGYAAVSVSTTGRSAAEAADRALDRLDFIRGVWNLWNNHRHPGRMSSGKRSPVNSIILGPIHTLHSSKGDLATNEWWYEPQYQGQVKVYNEEDKIDSMYEYTTEFLRLLKKSNYRQALVNAVVRYVRALDTRDWDDSFLRLWGVLEYLTDTTKADYKVTIRRASYIFSDREYARQALLLLKEYRNRFVHAGSQSSDIESLMYQVKRYVEKLILFHVGNEYRFLSLDDAGKFMDLSDNKSVIDSQISKLRYAKKFRYGP